MYRAWVWALKRIPIYASGVYKSFVFQPVRDLEWKSFPSPGQHWSVSVIGSSPASSRSWQAVHRERTCWEQALAPHRRWAPCSLGEIGLILVGEPVEP